MNLNQLAQQTAALARDRRDVAKQLQALLADQRAPVTERIKAAELLADLQFLPAIATLIDHIHLEPPEVSEASPPPLALALSRFGAAAVPPIIQAYFDHQRDVSQESQLREFAFFAAIAEGRNEDVAKTYVKGIAADLKDAEKIRKAEKFLNYKFR